MMRPLVACAAFTLTVGACSSSSMPPVSSGESSGIPAAVPTSTSSDDDAGSAPSATSALPAEWGPDKCPTGLKEGLDVGDQLATIVLRDCDGNDFSLARVCGASALWIFAAHGWCPHCQLVSKNAEAIHDSFAGRNLAAVNILVETASYQSPTAADCKAWRTANKQQDVVTLYDPNSATRGLWDNNTTALSVFVDHERRILEKSHTDSTAALKASIEKALSP